jgi:hypothetical protein
MRFRPGRSQLLAVLTTLALLVAGCTSSGDSVQTGGSTPPVSTHAPSTTVALSRGCSTTSRLTIKSIEAGLRKHTYSLRNGTRVKVTKHTSVIAAQVNGDHFKIGTWRYASGGIEAINAVARATSRWGAAAQPRSPAAKARARLLASTEHTRAIHCVQAKVVAATRQAHQRKLARQQAAKAAAKVAAKAAARRAAERRAAERRAAKRRAAASRSAAAPPPVQCTTTSSGSCIQGGEFCPQSSYGQQGTDANGRVYTCTGDTVHPHWET